MQPTKIM